MAFFFILWSILLAPAPAEDLHDLHLSKALINYNAENQAMEVSLHIFIDDLEMAMGEAGMTDLLIATSKESEEADEKIASYLSTIFQINVDAQEIDFNFLGKETSDDLMAIWCYLEAEAVTAPQSVSITHRLFLDYYDDQKNIVTFVSGDTKKYFMLDQDQDTADVDL